MADRDQNISKSVKDVVLLGWNVGNLVGLAHAFGKEQYNVICVKFRGENRKAPTWASIIYWCKDVSKLLYILRNDQEELLHTLMDVCPNYFRGEKALLVPSDDASVKLIDQNLDTISARYFTQNVLNEQGQVIAAMDKSYQKEKAREAGLLVANGVVVSVTNGEFDVPDDIQYPCFIKPAVSTRGSKRIMRALYSKQELTDHLKEITQREQFQNADFLVEDYLDFTAEYAVVGVSTGNDVWIPAMFRAMNGGEGAHRGVMAKGEIQPISRYAELNEKMIKFVKSMNYTGLFDIDLIDANGKMYFGELNLRLGASGAALLNRDINLPCALLKYFDHDEKPPVSKEVEEPYFFLNERVAIENILSGTLTRKEYLELKKGCTSSTFYTKDDKIPFLLFVFKFYWTKFKRLIRSFRRRRTS